MMVCVVVVVNVVLVGEVAEAVVVVGILLLMFRIIFRHQERKHVYVICGYNLDYN